MKYRVEFEVEMYAGAPWETAELRDWIENDSVDFILHSGLWDTFKTSLPAITRLDNGED